MPSIDNLHDDFMDNMAAHEEDFRCRRNKESAFDFAMQEALEKSSNSSTDDRNEDELDDDR